MTRSLHLCEYLVLYLVFLSWSRCFSDWLEISADPAEERCMGRATLAYGGVSDTNPGAVWSPEADRIHYSHGVPLVSRR